MPMIVTNNLNAMNAQRNLNINNSKMSTSLEKLSSGYKINSGKDDPSGLVISEQLRAQASGLKRAVQNNQEANNVLGIAEGALNEMNNILKKMRQLAIHSANTGVTSPEQVAADQAEVDSSVQTLDRIARTTKFSDQFLLNGNKQLNYESSVEVKDVKNNAMLDLDLTDVRNIFKKDDFKLAVNFSGGDATDGENGNEAQKGYFEVTMQAAATQMDATATSSTAYSITQDQAFTISGNAGSRYMTFAEDTHIGEVASSINNVVDSTGVKANLIFDSTATATTCGSAFDGTVGNRAAGEQEIFTRDANGEMTNTMITGATALAGYEVGVSTDGYGRVYLKMDSATEFTLYKDADMTMEVAKGVGGANITALNSSGLTGFNVTIVGGQAGSTAVVQVAETMEASNGSSSANMSSIATDLGTSFATNGSSISGVNLGVNTSDTGKIYTKFVQTGTNTQVFMYKDEKMREQDLVAKSENLTTAATTGIRVQAVLANDGTSSGLYATLNLNSAGGTPLNTAGTYTSEISFEDLGMRLSAVEYGSDQFVKVDVAEGELFSYYEKDNATPISVSAGQTNSQYGRDATISLNGQELQLDGIKGEVASLDATATLAFKEGDLGMTTIAAVGYNIGAYGSRAGTMNTSTGSASNITHAIKSTTETLADWTGGMQFQLGEGAGDQERTVFSLKSMTATDLGKVKFTDSFDDTGILSEKVLSVNDLLAGGKASLSTDPIKSLAIIDQAIKDVSNLRAQIGAFQANMLETNTNSLNVAIENITKTESYIRDTDMASASTEFTKNQIMVQAGTSMLAQANGLAQASLTLIG